MFDIFHDKGASYLGVLQESSAPHLGLGKWTRLEAEEAAYTSPAM